MPVDSEKTLTTADRQQVWIDREILRQAKTIAAIEDRTLSEVLERDLRPAIRRRFEKAMERAAAELGEAGA